MSIQMSIPIDGPAGYGKSTIAKLLAKKLGMRYVSTGDMYRALALCVIRNSVDPNDAEKVSELCKSSDICLEPSLNGGQLVFLNGEDVTSLVRTPEVDRVVSPVSLPEEVRKSMALRQREIAGRYDVVMDGRDIGTVVIPEALCKIFLVASVEERAKRRQTDYRNSGREVDLNVIIEDLKRRDLIDSTRKVAPLKQAEGAFLVDSTDKSIEQVLEEIYKLVKSTLK